MKNYLFIQILLLVVFTGGGLTQGNGQITVCAVDTSGHDNIEVQIAVSGFTDIVLAQWAFGYDPEYLTYCGVSIPEPGAIRHLSLANFSSPSDIRPNGLKYVLFSWDDPAAEGWSVPDGTVIYSLKFKVLKAGTTCVEPAEDAYRPFEMQAVNAGLELLNIIPKKATIILTDGPEISVSPSTGNPNPGGFGLPGSNTGMPRPMIQRPVPTMGEKEVFDLQGRYIGSFGSDNVLRNLSLPRGIYLVRDRDDADQRWQKVWISGRR